MSLKPHQVNLKICSLRQDVKHLHRHSYIVNRQNTFQDLTMNLGNMTSTLLHKINLVLTIKHPLVKTPVVPTLFGSGLRLSDLSDFEVGWDSKWWSRVEPVTKALKVVLKRCDLLSLVPGRHCKDHEVGLHAFGTRLVLIDGLRARLDAAFASHFFLKWKWVNGNLYRELIMVV